MSNISGFDPVLGASWAGGGGRRASIQGESKILELAAIAHIVNKTLLAREKTQKTQLNQIHEMT